MFCKVISNEYLVSLAEDKKEWDGRIVQSSDAGHEVNVAKLLTSVGV